MDGTGNHAEWVKSSSKDQISHLIIHP
jgi:hypothetical protein